MPPKLSLEAMEASTSSTEKIFDVIQIEAYESEIYKIYSDVDTTKLDCVCEALIINKI